MGLKVLWPSFPSRAPGSGLGASSARPGLSAVQRGGKVARFSSPSRGEERAGEGMLQI